MNRDTFIWKVFWIILFAISMAFVEAAVVVYLRAIYYPEGFRFPLRAITDYKIVVELFREFATILMLLSVSMLSGRKLYERFAYFMIAFGVWDIFYYIWLKVSLDWPSTIFEWDILFLIPLPWIGPVIAPVSISILLIIFGVFIAYLFQKGREFKPTLISYIFALAGAVVILYSFMKDTDATLHQRLPQPYQYELLIIGELFFIGAFLVSYVKMRAEGNT
jgi:hypothetical protein